MRALGLFVMAAAATLASVTCARCPHAPVANLSAHRPVSESHRQPR
jgi:hypothetical protein